MRRLLERRNSVIDKSLFVFFALFGSACIFALKLWGIPQLIVTLIPIGIMLLYAILAGSQWTRFRLRPDQAGDNCYYLGFIYTLVSLGLALYSFSTTAPGDSLIEIVKDFGIALATTLAGVTLRVLLHQLREDPADVEEAGRRELGTAAARVTGQLSSMLRDVAAFRLQTQDELKRFAYESKQVAEEYRAALNVFHEQSKMLGDEVLELVKRVRGADAPMLEAASRFGKLEEDRQRASVELIERARDAVVPIERASAAFKELPPVAEAATKALEQLVLTTSAAFELQSKAIEVSKQLADAAERLTKLHGLTSVLDRIELLERTHRRKRKGLFGWTSTPDSAA